MDLSQQIILIVEDDTFDVKLMERAIRKAQLVNPIRTLPDGEAAIAYLAGNEPYEDREQHPLPVLMILDLKLPRKTGFEVLEWLQSQSRLRRLPVVVLTSSTETTDVNRAYDLGANSYLVKLVGVDALADMVKTLDIYWMFVNEKPDLEAN